MLALKCVLIPKLKNEIKCQKYIKVKICRKNNPNYQTITPFPKKRKKITIQRNKKCSTPKPIKNYSNTCMYYIIFMLVSVYHIKILYHYHIDLSLSFKIVYFGLHYLYSF